MPATSRGRKVRDADEAKQLLAAWSRSGVPMADWCKQRGVSWYSLAAFKGWPKRARATGEAPHRKSLQGESHPHSQTTTQSTDAPAFVEVDTTKTVPHNDAPMLYRLRVGSITVETDASFDEDSLRRLLRLVASC